MSDFLSECSFATLLNERLLAAFDPELMKSYGIETTTLLSLARAAHEQPSVRGGGHELQLGKVGLFAVRFECWHNGEEIPFNTRLSFHASKRGSDGEEDRSLEIDHRQRNKVAVTCNGREVFSDELSDDYDEIERRQVKVKLWIEDFLQGLVAQ